MNQASLFWNTCQNFQVIHHEMEAKILMHATYNTESYLTLLQESIDWFPDKNNNNKKSDSLSFSFFELVVLPLIGLSIIYVLYFIIRCIYLNVPATPDETIYNRENCPICLNEFTAPIRANCGHAFCIKCLLHYFTSNPTKHNCPLCRNYIQDFECLNKFSFEDKEQVHEYLLEEELRNRIPQQNIHKVMILQGQHAVIFLMVIYFLIICFMYCIVQLFEI